MQLKKIPMRMCVACRTMKPQKELIRIVKNGEMVFIDYSGKANGRGAYVCNSIECIKKCIKTKALNRTFKSDIPANVYEKLLEDFVEKNS